uniref:NADAR domain-containing protein n=2 Tax=Strongyloides stercoralis TaxID=6248 RepID=A0A0K0EF61_STRER
MSRKTLFSNREVKKDEDDCASDIQLIEGFKTMDIRGVSKKKNHKKPDKSLAPNLKTIRKNEKCKRKNFPYFKHSYYDNTFVVEEDDETVKGEPYKLESYDVMEFVITPATVIIVRNSSNIYSSVYGVENLKYNNINFHSVDEGYQYHKLLEICGESIAQQLQYYKTTFQKRLFVKKTLTQYNKGRRDVIKWRQEKGLKILVELTVRKFVQNPALLIQMKEDKNKIILNAFAQDDYDACGVMRKLREWLQKNKNLKVKIPYMAGNIFINSLPKMSTGKNIQGVIVMTARRLIENCDWEMTKTYC